MIQITGNSPFFRWLKFNAVGAMGTLVQLGVLVVLMRILASHTLWATALAVETAVVHNFFWHWAWTWSDRHGVGYDRMAIMLVRFNLSNGMVSLCGTVLCTAILGGMAHLSALPSSVIAFIPCWLVNYLVSDRFVFGATS